ncbi:MAG: prepilin peptidase [Patescibacteria group bacterium]|nr:prepilin peptidase [Patescibacteria group bacterium]
MVEIFIFLFGLAVGSFLNCVIYRLETSENFLNGRSFCPNCKHILSWPDLIPLFSFLILKGKCRYCQQKISWQYPFVEIVTGLLFFLITNYQLPITNFSEFITLCFLFLVSCFLIIIFVYDLKHYIIPDKVIYPAIITASIFNFQFLIFNQFSIFKNLISSALGASIFFLVIVLISKGKWMGVGDVKLAFLMGLILGWPNILIALFLAFLIGAIIGLILIFLRKKTLKSEIPFGPFLIFGTFITIFFGEKIIDWYLNLFLLK